MLVCHLPCLAIHDAILVSARSRAMGNASVMLADTWSGLQNQSGLATVKNPLFAFHYENRFMIAEMGFEAFTCCMPAASGTFGLNYAHFGHQGYNENKTGLAFGKSIGDRFRAGIELDYFRVRQTDDYGNLHAFIPGLGIQLLPLENFILAFHIYNPANQSFSNHKSERIPVTIRTGMGYFMEDDLLVCFEVLKRSGEDPAFATGMEYKISETLNARMGVLFSEYMQASFGIGFHVKSLHADFAVWRHDVLGYSPSVSLSWSLENK